MPFSNNLPIDNNNKLFQHIEHFSTLERPWKKELQLIQIFENKNYLVDHYKKFPPQIPG